MKRTVDVSRFDHQSDRQIILQLLQDISRHAQGINRATQKAAAKLKDTGSTPGTQAAPK